MWWTWDTGFSNRYLWSHVWVLWHFSGHSHESRWECWCSYWVSVSHLCITSMCLRHAANTNAPKTLYLLHNNNDYTLSRIVNYRLHGHCHMTVHHSTSHMLSTRRGLDNKVLYPLARRPVDLKLHIYHKQKMLLLRCPSHYKSKVWYERHHANLFLCCI